MHAKTTRVTRLARGALLPGLLLSLIACDSGAGCDDVLRDLDAPISPSAYFNEAAKARVSAAGVTFLEDNLAPIVQSFASSDCTDVWCPGGWGTCNGANECRSNDPQAAFIGVGVPPTDVTDQSYPVNYIRICKSNENPAFEDCNVFVRVDNVDLNPSSTTADLSVTLDVTIWSSNILTYIDYDFPFTSSLCYMYIRDADDPQLPVYKTITADVDFENGNPLGRLAIRPSNIGLSVSEDDLYVENCILEYGWIKSLVWGFIEDSIYEQIDTTLQSTIEGLLSESCAAAPCSRTDVSHCATDDLCRFNSNDEAVPRLLGMEGDVALDALLGGFAGRAQGLDFSAFANAGGTSNGGVDLELKAAAVAENSDCVPTFAAPNPNLPAFSPQGSGYHVAIGASDKLLNRILHEAFSSGVLCQSLGGLAALNSGAVSLLIPSLGEITGGSVPLTIDVLPRKPAELQIGANVVGPDPNDPDVQMLIEPLLTLVLDDLDLDIYAEQNGALFRVITLRTDLAVDLSLAIGGNGELQLVAGDASRWLQDLQVLNGDLLAESPTDIEDSIPVLLGVVLPLLTDSLDQTFPIPTFSGFSLNVTQITGAQSYGNTAYDKTRYAHLALYANLGFDPNASPLEVARADTVAELLDVELPDVEGLRTGEKVRVRIAADIAGRPTEMDDPVLWSRVDGGFWRPLVQGRELVVTDPVLHLEGEHLIEVAAARPEEPRSLDLSPAEISVLVDAQAPTLEVWAERGGVAFHAEDSVATAAELTVRVTVDGLTRAVQPLDESGAGFVAIDPTQHRVRVQVEDLVGRTAEAFIGEIPATVTAGSDGEPLAAATPGAPPRGDGSDAVGSPGSLWSCAGAGPAPLGMLGLLGLLGLLRRRRR